MATLVAKKQIMDKLFAEKYVKNGFNGQATMLELKPNLKENSAKVIAANRLTDINQQKAIRELLEEKGLTREEAVKINKRNAKQFENIPASNAAVETYFKLNGDLKDNPGGDNHLHLHLHINEVEEKIKAVDAELAELEG